MDLLQPLPQQEFKVRVSCSTYNHSKFITQALEGFVMQKTNFPFVCTIIDDASTDGEQKIITNWISQNCKPTPVVFQEDYADVFVVEHKDNSNCTLVFYLLKENHRAKRKSKAPYIKAWKRASEYCAICEGDDYWTDPLKLQVQADFLDTHPDYSAVATQSMVIYQSGSPSHLFSKHTRDIDWEIGSLIGGRQFHTATVMYRPCIELENRPKVFSGDIAMMMVLSQKGKWMLMSRCTGVYRKHSGGDSSNVELSDLKRDLLGIPYYLKINPKFPVRRYKAYLYYTFSVFPPDNSVRNILKYGLMSIWLSLTSFPVDFYKVLRTVYYVYLKLVK